MGNKNEYPSFWLSYANVIGGLFFIITLILTSMLAKYNIIAQDLNKSKGILENKIKDINELKLKLSESEIATDKTLSTLQNSKDKSANKEDCTANALSLPNPLRIAVSPPANMVKKIVGANNMKCSV